MNVRELGSADAQELKIVSEMFCLDSHHCCQWNWIHVTTPLECYRLGSPEAFTEMEFGVKDI